VNLKVTFVTLLRTLNWVGGRSGFAISDEALDEVRWISCLEEGKISKRNG
jgi:hypothetical protein